jgi:hypothetical protein
MITHASQAAPPTNVVNSEQNQLVYFGVGSTSQTSQTFTVDQQPFYLSAYNLATGDVITVQQVFGQGSGTEVASFAPVNGAVVLTSTRTKVRIDHPGRYQLLHSGPSALGTFTVAGGAMVMTSEPIGDISEALYQTFTTLSGNITVTAPITLSGAGTSADPYDIGISSTAGSAPPNFVEVEGVSPIAVTGNGTAATPYMVSTAQSFTYTNLGTIGASGNVNINWTLYNAVEFTLTGNGLSDVLINNLPTVPGFLLVKVTQSSAGGATIQFTNLWGGGNLYNYSGQQISAAANAVTMYLVFCDGINSMLVQYGGSGVGPL